MDKPPASPSIFEIRREQLSLLSQEKGGHNELGRLLGLKKGAYISQIINNNPKRTTLSEKTARTWEKKLKLIPGWFDTPSGAATINVDVLAATLSTIADTLKDLASQLRSSPPASRPPTSLSAKDGEPPSAEQQVLADKVSAALRKAHRGKGGST
jgi:hypothetical protein